MINIESTPIDDPEPTNAEIDSSNADEEDQINDIAVVEAQDSFLDIPEVSVVPLSIHIFCTD